MTDKSSFVKVKELFDVLETSSDSDKDMLCAVCVAVGDRRKAVKYCFECGNLVCQHCVDIHHRFRQMKEHKLVDICKEDDLIFCQKLSSMLVCPNHSDKTVELLCKNHNALCCLTCATVSHRKCSNVVEVAKEAADPEQKPTVDDFRNHLNAADQHISTVIKELEKSKEEFIAAADIHIPAKLQELKAKINQIFAELEQSIIENCVEKKRLYVAQSDNKTLNWMKERDSVREAIGFLASVQQNHSDIHLYIVMNQLRNKLNAVDEAIAKQGNVLAVENISLKEGIGLRQVLRAIPGFLSEVCGSKSAIPLPEYKFTQKEGRNLEKTATKKPLQMKTRKCRRPIAYLHVSDDGSETD